MSEPVPATKDLSSVSAFKSRQVRFSQFRAHCRLSFELLLAFSYTQYTLTMHLPFYSVVLPVGLMTACADGVLGGSRLWEAQAPNPRTNPDPFYPMDRNPTSALARRAVSIKNQPDNINMPRLWPEKRIRYCFEEEGTRIKGLWELAMNSWAELKDNGFSYEKVGSRACRDDRANVLRIHYNAEGQLRSSVGIPTLDELHPDIEGPETHLSDKLGIGQDNVQANVAHELGHVWGLYHEHQIRKWWETSPEHFGKPEWGAQLTSPEPQFQTNGFNCQALKNYDNAMRAAEEAGQRDPDGHGNDARMLCTSADVAGDYKFGASDWLPTTLLDRMKSDDDFDRDSLMLYPSRAGGVNTRGDENTDGENRMVVMTYINGDLIPNRIAPSPMDIARLVTLYGTTRPALSALVSVTMKTKFKEARRLLYPRAGDTASGMC